VEPDLLHTELKSGYMSMARFANRIDSLRKKIHHSQAMKAVKKTPLHPVLGLLFRGYIKSLSTLVSDYRHEVKIGSSVAQYHIETGDDFTHIVGLDGEKPVLTGFIQDIRSDDIVYDVGSHLGLYSCLAASKAGKVYCFEPHPGNLEALRKNIELNNLENIKIIEYALSDEERTFLMPGKDTRANAAVSDMEGELEINSVTGDVLVEEKIKPATVVKIDVEGHEYQAVKGLEETLRDSCRVLYCEVHPEDLKDFGHSEEEFYDLVEKLGFQNIDIIHERGPQKFIRAEK